ncbi:hypothetical protein EDEG_05103, partial [Edhazardia aedis USNM 41457]
VATSGPQTYIAHNILCLPRIILSFDTIKGDAHEPTHEATVKRCGKKKKDVNSDRWSYPDTEIFNHVIKHYYTNLSIYCLFLRHSTRSPVEYGTYMNLFNVNFKCCRLKNN